MEPSTQSVFAFRGGDLVERRIPHPGRRVVGHEIYWGGAEEIGSPAYWSAQAWMWELEDPDHYRLGRSLRDEVLACLLGGYGIPAEVGLAAYDRLRAATDDDLMLEETVLEMLLEPLTVGDRTVRYRFARQKAKYVASAIRELTEIRVDCSDRTLRDRLVELPGIGLKTASWIVRNWRGSDDVSILDIHIIRASCGLGLFPEDWRVERHYRQMEDAYLRFAHAIGARASILDSVMWMTMRALPASVTVTMRQAPSSSPGTKRVAVSDRSQLLLT